MFFKVIIAIALAILTQYILSPVLYGLRPSYYNTLLGVPFGVITIFVLDNAGFFLVFIPLAVYIWKGLSEQQVQNNYGYGVGQ